jgi:hypothetical protein
MPKTIEELTALLPEADRGDLVAAITAATSAAIQPIAAERDKFKGLLDPKTKEIERLLNKHKPIIDALKKNGFDTDSEELPAQLDDLKELAGKVGQLSEAEKTMKEMKKKIDDLTVKEAEKDSKLRLKTLTEKLESVIGPELVDSVKAYVIPQLIASGTAKLGDDGETVTFKLDGEDFDLKAGAAKWIKENPGLIKSKQIPGGGSTGGGVGGSRKTPDGHLEMNEADWRRLDPIAQARFLVDEKGKSTGNKIT